MKLTNPTHRSAIAPLPRPLHVAPPLSFGVPSAAALPSESSSLGVASRPLLFSPAGTQWARPAPYAASLSGKGVRATQPVTAARAARGDDDLMSQVQEVADAGSQTRRAQWRLRISQARIAWNRLSVDELLKSDGHEDTLSGLVQERYAISPGEAGKQVRHFLAHHRG